MMTILSKSAATRPGLLARLWARLWKPGQIHLQNLSAAHARQARFAALDPHAAQDTALPPEVMLDEQAYHPALPFFLQSRFDRRD